MEILVCIKQVPESNKVEVDPDTNEIKIDPETNTLVRDGVPSIVNTFDGYALEAAARVKDNNPDTKIVVLSMGPAQAEAVIREAYAMGADEGWLITDRRFGGADVLATSYTLSQGIRRAGPFDLILCGKQTTDGDTAQVGSEISEALSLPAVAGVLRILSAEAEAITVEMDLTDKVETVRVSLPCLLSVEKDIAQPRLPSYVRKQAMKDAPIHRLTLSDMEDTDAAHYGLSGSPTQVQRIFPPESNHKQEKWTGTGPELAGRLFGLLKEQKLWQGGR